MMHKHKKWLSLLLTLSVFMLMLTGCGSEPAEKKEAAPKKEKPQEMILATTTSTQDSGLLDALLPVFEEENNVEVKTVAVGTGEALELGERGEADALLVHAPKSEQPLVDSGDVTNYKRVMYNDYIIVGPKADPAGIKGMPINEAFKKITAENAGFVSRGDDSGTHKKEKDVWAETGAQPAANPNYISSGQGMGATLQIATEKGYYTLTDRATYLAQEKNMPDFEIIVEGDPGLQNVYHVMQVNPEKHPDVNAEPAEAFVAFMVSDEAQKMITEFGVEEYGEPLFYSYLDDEDSE